MSEFPEWILWAKRLKDEHHALLTRIESLEAECAHLRQTKASPRILQSPARKESSPPLQRGIPQPQNKKTAVLTIPLRRAPSEVTTVAATSLAGPPSTPRKAAAATTTSINAIEPLGQGIRDLRSYFQTQQEAQLRQETKAVQAFLDGLKSGHQRFALESALERQGRTWQNLCVEVQAMVTAAERRRGRSRRSLPVEMD